MRPNPEWASYAARVFFWQNVFLHGRGLFAIIRLNGQPYELWPMSVPAVRVTMDSFGVKSYTVTSVAGEPLPGKTFSSADVIDVPFMLSSNMVSVLSPVLLGAKALSLALAMQDYGGTFFAGGGVPPLALEGRSPRGPKVFNGRWRTSAAQSTARARATSPFLRCRRNTS
jgi:phage portal protein BeeE